MNAQYVKNVVEASLLAAGRPLNMEELVGIFDERDGPNADEIRAALDTLGGEYQSRGIELLEVASGYRIQISSAVAQPVSRLWQERPTKYSRALLETLALVAYRQPITRGEIEQIRGVAVNPNIVRILLERGWIRILGHRDVPGKPELLGTTREFLDYFSLKKLDDLPTLSQLKELEELRVQLTLPGPPAVAVAQTEGLLPHPQDAHSNAVHELHADAAAVAAAAVAAEHAAADEEAADDEDETALRDTLACPQGLVARGERDESH